VAPSHSIRQAVTYQPGKQVGRGGLRLPGASHDVVERELLFAIGEEAVKQSKADWLLRCVHCSRKE
jgi:hypothetical protein